MTKYSNGANYERMFKNKLLKDGAEVVIRSAGSKTKIDLTAFYLDKVEVYQIKSTSQIEAYYGQDMYLLKNLYLPRNTKKFIAVYYKRNKKRGYNGWVIIEVK